MIRIKTAAVVLAGAALLQAPVAFAQSDPPASRFEAGIGALWIGSQPLGDKFVTETTASRDSQPLFHMSSELAGAAGFAARLGVRVARSLVAEAEASYLTPQLRVELRADTEGAVPVTAIESVQQFTIGGGVRWYLPLGRRRRLAPFATAGGGYLRQLHEAATLVETGRFYQFGTGVDVLLASGRHFHTKGSGVRLDARAVIRSQGVAFDGGSKTSAAFGASAFVRF